MTTEDMINALVEDMKNWDKTTLINWSLSQYRAGLEEENAEAPMRIRRIYHNLMERKQ